jgi:DNA-binding GntR family transcriptional regulator
MSIGESVMDSGPRLGVGPAEPTNNNERILFDIKAKKMYYRYRYKAVNMRITLRPLKKGGSLKAHAASNIREAIFGGKFAPGDALRELHLARELKISQATVREALAQLEREGLVVRVPNKETVVTNLSRQEVRERLTLRVVLEGIAFAQAADRMEELHYCELARLTAAISEAVASRVPHELAQADLRFHRYVWEQSGNKTLFQMLDQLCAPLFAFMSILRRKGIEQPNPNVQPHEALVAALRNRDPEEIVAAIRAHLGNSAYERFLGSGINDFQQYAQMKLARTLPAPIRQ